MDVLAEFAIGFDCMENDEIIKSFFFFNLEFVDTSINLR